MQRKHSFVIQVEVGEGEGKRMELVHIHYYDCCMKLEDIVVVEKGGKVVMGVVRESIEVEVGTQVEGDNAEGIVLVGEFVKKVKEEGEETLKKVRVALEVAEEADRIVVEVEGQNLTEDLGIVVAAAAEARTSGNYSSLESKVVVGVGVGTVDSRSNTPDILMELEVAMCTSVEDVDGPAAHRTSLETALVGRTKTYEEALVEEAALGCEMRTLPGNSKAKHFQMTKKVNKTNLRIVDWHNEPELIVRSLQPDSVEVEAGSSPELTKNWNDYDGFRTSLVEVEVVQELERSIES